MKMIMIEGNSLRHRELAVFELLCLNVNQKKIRKKYFSQIAKRLFHFHSLLLGQFAHLLS